MVESNCKNAPFQADDEARSRGCRSWRGRKARDAIGTGNSRSKLGKCGACQGRYQMSLGKHDNSTVQGSIPRPSKVGSIQLTENENGRDGVWSQTYAECHDGCPRTVSKSQSAGCGENSDQNDNWWFCRRFFRFSFDETTKASCKKMVQATRRQFDGQQQVETDVTADWKAIDWNLEQYPGWLWTVLPRALMRFVNQPQQRCQISSLENDWFIHHR